MLLLAFCLDFLFSNTGSIPSAASVDAARRRRHLARTRADYLPLDVSNSHQVSWRKDNSDLESEDESFIKNLDFVPKMRTLRQRMAEHMGEFVPFLSVVVALFYCCLGDCGTCPVKSECSVRFNSLAKGCTAGARCLHGTLIWVRSC